MLLSSPTLHIQTPPQTEWVQTNAASVEAQYLVQVTDESRKHMGRAVSLENRLDRMINELLDVYTSRREVNWDGYGADPVSVQTVGNAERLLRLLPSNLPVPDFGAEADGHLTMEWYKSPDRVVSLSVSPEGLLHYAALLGPVVRQNGTELLGSTFPAPLVDLIRRVMGNA